MRREGGSHPRENAGEIEDIEPGAAGDVVLDLPPEQYALACLVVPGEAGSTIDHYQAGVRVPFTVR